VTPARVLELKGEAKALKQVHGLKQWEALARIAQREGYRTWEDLLSDAGGAAVVREAKFDAPPTEAQVRRAERRADRQRRYGDAL
jgi:hypothetical protein